MKKRRGVKFGRMVLLGLLLLAAGYYVAEIMNSVASIFFFGVGIIVLMVAAMFKLREWIGLPVY